MQEIESQHAIGDLHEELVETRHDPKTGLNHYTIARADRRWTIAVPLADFDRYGPLTDEAGKPDEVSKQRRRAHLANLLSVAMQGKADGEEQ